MNREFTRGQLHALVWSQPTSTIAKELGISDVALGKTCRKLSVPKPPPGYWAKVAHCKFPKKKALHRAPTGTPTKAVIQEQPKKCTSTSETESNTTDTEHLLDV